MSVRVLSLLGIVALATPLVQAQPTGPAPWPVVAVEAAWQPGQSWAIEIIEGALQQHPDGSTVRDSTTTRYQKVVTGAGDGYFRVAWFFDERGADAEDDAEQDWTEAVDELLWHRVLNEGLILRMTEEGQLAALENRQLYLAIHQASIDFYLQAAEGPEQAAERAARLAQMGGAEALVDQMLEPIVLFYGLNGQAWPVGEPQTLDGLFPFGSGHVVPTTLTIEVHDVDPAAGTFRLRHAQRARGQALEAAAREFFAGQGLVLEAAAEAAFEESFHFLVDFERGIVQALDRVLVLSYGATRREEFLRIRATPL